MLKRGSGDFSAETGEAMNIDIYSDRAKQAVQAAQSLALARRHQQFAPDHLLKALLDAQDGLAKDLVKQAGGEPDKASARLRRLWAKCPKWKAAPASFTWRRRSPGCSPPPRMTPKKAGDAFVTTERLLIALAKDGGSSAKALQASGVDAAKLETAAAAVRKGRTADSASAEEGYDALKRYARDLTQAARDQKLIR